MGEGEGEDGGRAQRGKRRRGRGGEDPAKHQATLRKRDEARERDGGGDGRRRGGDLTARRSARHGRAKGRREEGGGRKQGGGGSKHDGEEASDKAKWAGHRLHGSLRRTAGGALFYGG